MLQILRFTYRGQKHGKYLTTFYMPCICIAKSFMYIQALPKALTSSVTCGTWHMALFHKLWCPTLLGQGPLKIHGYVWLKGRTKARGFFFPTQSYKVLLKNYTLEWKLVCWSLTCWYKHTVVDFR